MGVGGEFGWSGELQLATQPVLGNWRITATKAVRQ